MHTQPYDRRQVAVIQSFHMLIHWLILTIAILIVSHLYSGIRVVDLPVAIVAAAVLGILNAVVRPVLQFFALPITFLTLGIFYFVINGLMLYWTAIPRERLRRSRLWSGDNWLHPH